jgi:hypothetical protein
MISANRVLEQSADEIKENGQISLLTSFQPLTGLLLIQCKGSIFGLPGSENHPGNYTVLCF